MTKFRCIHEVEIDADDPVEAAFQAQAQLITGESFVWEITPSVLGSYQPAKVLVDTETGRIVG